MPFKVLNERPTARRLVPDWCGFWFTAPLLVGAVFCEAVFGFFAAIAFVFTRHRQRERLKALLYCAKVVVLGLALGSLTAGCVTSKHPGASFGDQIDNLAWSVDKLTEDDWRLEELRYTFHAWVVEDFTIGGDDFVQSFEMLGW